MRGTEERPPEMRNAALVMIERTRKPGRCVTLAGDKLFDAASFVTV